MSGEWAKLIQHYADGRPICNCGDAYYTPCGVGGILHAGGAWEPRADLLACEHGCDANRYAVKDEIARRVLQELGQ